MPKQLYHYTHSSPEITTLADLLTNQDSPCYLYFNQPETFLNIIGEDGLTNRQRIESTYTLPSDPAPGTKFSRMTIKVGTLLYLEYEKVNQPSFLTAGIEVVSTDEPAFKAEKLAEIEADPGYYQIDKPIHGQLQKGSLKTSYPDCSVWIWCRALSPRKDEDLELTGQIFNITPFIESLTTNVTKNGGNFEFKLSPITCQLDSDNKWVIKRNTLTHYQNDNFSSLQGDGFLSVDTLFHTETLQENPNKASDDVLVRNQFLFHNMISQNDLVFIKLETLEMEKEKRYIDANEFFINKNNLANNIYDMIGLVDTTTQSINPANTDVTISVKGRDLSKLFIEDGTYFYALENSQGVLKFAGQSTLKDPQINRIFADGGMSFIGLYMFQSIETILKFIIQQLSNIKITPDELFTSYAKTKKKLNGRTIEYDSRTKVFRQEGFNGIDNKKRDQVRKQALVKIDTLRSAANTKNSFPQVESKKQNEIFSEMNNFIETLRNDKRRKVNKLGETISWKSFTYKGEKLDEGQFPEYFRLELFPVTGEVSQEMVDLVHLTDQYIDLGTPSKKYVEKLAAGVWQLIDLVIDSGVAKRKLVDSSMSTASGSLLNFIRSACQEPLVEFFMDTYGDRYHLIVRKPPYDQKGMITLLEGRVNTQSGVAEVPPAVINIEPEDVLIENLTFETTSYSWYHFFPKTAIMGNSEEYSLSYLGALYFKEYAEVFGTHPFQQSNTYIPYTAISNSNETGLGVDERQAIEDLKYVIESNQYLPFSRKGTLTLNRDRRLKIGNIIRYKSTGEVGFITGVQHSFMINENNIDAVTTINVERMLIEQFIYGKYMANENGQPRFVSYFNIINTDLVFKMKKVKKTVSEAKRKKSLSTARTNDASTTASFVVDNFLQNSQVIETGQNKGLGFLDTYNAFPKYKNRFIAFINAINRKGYWVSITPLGANRTYIQQAALKRANPNNADPGHSKHESGRAIDITLIDKRTGEVHSKNSSKERWIATGVPAIAKSLGLRWAGGDGSFGKYIDRVHFEIKDNLNDQTVSQSLYEQLEFENKIVEKSEMDRFGIFGNFKTDSFSFNFFKKRLQFSDNYKQVSTRYKYGSKGLLLNEITLRYRKKGN